MDVLATIIVSLYYRAPFPPSLPRQGQSLLLRGPNVTTHSGSLSFVLIVRDQQGDQNGTKQLKLALRKSLRIASPLPLLP